MVRHTGSKVACRSHLHLPSDALKVAVAARARPYPECRTIRMSGVQDFAKWYLEDLERVRHAERKRSEEELTLRKSAAVKSSLPRSRSGRQEATSIARAPFGHDFSHLQSEIVAIHSIVRSTMIIGAECNHVLHCVRPILTQRQNVMGFKVPLFVLH